MPTAHAMNAETVKKKIAARLSIPSLPAVLQKLDELLKDPDVGMREIGLLIGQDPPLSAKVLRIANSSYYGLREPAVTIEHAASVLGINALRNMLMEATMFRAWAHLEGTDAIDLAELWKHSILTGRIAERLAGILGGLPVTKDEVYVAGLLHDLGRLALLDTFPNESLEAIERSRQTGKPHHVCEQEVIGIHHAQVGGLISRRWGLPKATTFAVLHHHQLTGGDAERRVVAMVSLANEISHLILDGTLGKSTTQVDPALLKTLKLDLAAVLTLGAEFRERVNEIKL